MSKTPVRWEAVAQGFLLSRIPLLPRGAVLCGLKQTADAASHEATRWQGRAVSRGMSSLPTHCHRLPKGLLTQHLQYLWPHPLERVHEQEIRDFSILCIHPLLRLVRNFLSLWGQEVNKLCILLIRNVTHISTFPCMFCLNDSIRPVITKPSKVSAPPHPFTPHSYYFLYLGLVLNFLTWIYWVNCFHY